MHPNNRRLFVPIVVAVGLACLPLIGQKKAAPVKSAAPALDKAALEKYVRHLYLWPDNAKVEIEDPRPSGVPGMREVLVKASVPGAQDERALLISSDGKKMIQGLVYDLGGNPFRGEIEKLKTESAPSMGTPGAPVVLVVFTDFQCPYCRDEAKMLRANLLSAYPKEVRLYFKDFPLEPIHPWAKQAAIAGRCIFQQNEAAFWLYHDWVFEKQSELAAESLNNKVLEFAQGKPVDALQLRRCLETRATEAEVTRSIMEAQSLRVDSTPTLFINGRRISQSLAWPQLKSFLDFEINYQKTANNAGDRACCEVRLTSPVAK
jgi:protein-disulfide isomerase